jgi:transcriptional regulator with XRE-family HTH domain
LTGSLEGWEGYYQRRQQAEVIQGILGRQRAARYPETFTCYVLTGANDDLSYLKDSGAALTTQTAFEICPDAGDATQTARWRLLQALKATANATQGALAKALGISQQAVSKLLKGAGVTLQTLKTALEKLTTDPIKALYRAGCETNELLSAFDWFFDLDPADILTEATGAAREGKFTQWLDLFPAPARAKILGTLYAFLAPEMSFDPSPPPPN